MNKENITPELFRERFRGLLETIALQSDQKERAENFGAVMDKAREFGMGEEVTNNALEVTRNLGVPELWELPKPFEKNVQLAEFPVGCLPDVLSTYLKEISANIQVSPDMAALPLLSVLSLVTQGKALIRNPGGGNTETLNLYTLTIAEPGERKSGVFRSLTAPIYQYQKEENKRREPLIKEYQIRKNMLTKQLETVSRKCDSGKIREIYDELNDLKPVHHLTLNVTDTTPEAVSDIMSRNGEKMGILNDEGGIFDILSGMYSKGTANIDLFLKAYDGSPYNVIRCGRSSIDLENPILTFGIMTQTEPFKKAMENPQFSGRGLVHRFLYAFPESRTGNRTFTSPAVSDKAKEDYSRLIFRLLSIKKDSEPVVISCSKKAEVIFSDYHYMVEERMKSGGAFEYMKEWANKQVGRALKIAGILHLCTHEPTEPLDEKTAQSAVSIAYWSEHQAMRAFGEVTANEEYRDAKYVWDKIRKAGALEISKRDIYRACRGRIKSSDEIDEPLNVLEDMGYIRVADTEYVGSGRKPAPKYKINPYTAD